MSKYQSIDIPTCTKSVCGDDLSNIDPEQSPLLKPSPSKPEQVKKSLLVSVYVLLSTLFFGFAAGFSVGFYVFGALACDGGLSNLSPFEILSKSTNKLQSLFPDSTILGSTTPVTKIPSRKLLYLNSADAYALLLDSTSIGSSTISIFSNDFFLISSGLDAQLNQEYCAAAAVAAILNSLRFLINNDSHQDGVNIPVDLAYNPYPYATQVDIFSECTQKTVISQTGGDIGIDGIMTPPYGLNMGQAAQVLRCHLDATTNSGGGTWRVESHYADKTHMTVGKVKFDLKNALQNANSRVLVNYDRSVIDQDGGGHWSPVGSYSDKWDAFLILDVAKYKYPPVWIPAERLFAAMATYDDCGTWNYPAAQGKLSVEERNGSDSAKVLATLGCKKELRGYIIVTKST